MARKQAGGGKRYPFRNEATGKIRWVSFETMMQADCMGVISEPGGSAWRRARDLEPRVMPKRSEPKAGNLEIISDSLGFCRNQLDEMEESRRAGGFSGIEFREDPQVPNFFQVRCSSRAAQMRYAKHRGMVDRSSVNGSSAMLSAESLALARKRVQEQYPVKTGKTVVC